MNAIFHRYRHMHKIMPKHCMLCLYILLFIGTQFSLTLHAQTLEAQVETWNTTNPHSIVIDSIHSTIDWTTFIITSTIKVTWPQNDSPYIMPTRALDHIKTIFPSILTYCIKNIPSISNVTLLETIDTFSLSSEVFTQLLNNSLLQQYLPDKNIFSINIIYTTELLPTMYQFILPQYNEREIPSTISIEYKNDIQYSAIIFSTENDIATITDKNTLIRFTPKLLPQVYGWDGTLIYTPEYYKKDAPQSFQRTYFYFDIEDISTIEIGNNPYIVIPQTINNEQRGDIIISKTDTLTILNNNSLRDAIQQGRVFFALSNKNTDILHYSVSTYNDTTQ